MSELKIYFALQFFFPLLLLANEMYSSFGFRATTRLKIQYFGFFLLLLVPFSLKLIPTSTSMALPEFPMPQVFSKIGSFADSAASVRIIPHVENVDSGPSGLFIFLIIFIVSGFLIQFYQWFCGIRYIFKTINAGFVFRKLGQIQIVSSDHIDVPFSFSWLLRSYVVIPNELFGKKDLFQCSLAHEIQHLRQKDTTWLYCLQITKCIFFINPFAHMWVKKINLNQEMACDESLLSRKRLSAPSYANCLLELAERISTDRNLPVGAMGLILQGRCSQLKRRIQNMSQFIKQPPPSRWFFCTALFLLVLSFLSTSYALKSNLTHNSIGKSELQRIIAKDNFPDGFHVSVNTEVLKWINYYARNPKGSAFSNKALERFAGHQKNVLAMTSNYGLPDEMAAVAFVESGYRNVPMNLPKHKAAGVWQFIPSTAIAYNMKVEVGGVDERMDSLRATRGAMLYLKKLSLQFDDLGLAVLSYNAGEGNVKSGIEKHQTHNVWQLSRKGVNGDKDYYPRVVAAMILMKHPELIE